MKEYIAGVLQQHYGRRDITKEQFKEILKKALGKVMERQTDAAVSGKEFLTSKKRDQIKDLVKAYVARAKGQ